jgi:hypothetical protein
MALTSFFASVSYGKDPVTTCSADPNSFKGSYGFILFLANNLHTDENNKFCEIQGGQHSLAISFPRKKQCEHADWLLLPSENRVVAAFDSNSSCSASFDRGLHKKFFIAGNDESQGTQTCEKSWHSMPKLQSERIEKISKNLLNAMSYYFQFRRMIDPQNPPHYLTSLMSDENGTRYFMNEIKKFVDDCK